MLRKTLATLLIAGLAGSAGLALGQDSAGAATVGYAPIATPSHVQPVRWVYVPARHGVRYRVRRPGFAYYYGGWWYSRPWWSVGVGPVVIGGGPVVIGGGPVWRPIYGPRYHYWRPGYVHHNGWYYRHRWW